MNELYTFLSNELKQLGAFHETQWIVDELRALSETEAWQKAQDIIQRKKKGEPLAYILGHWDFRKLKVAVGSGVLIPRPETEELVEHVLDYLARDARPSLRIVDFGSGSGAIAYSLLAEAKKEIEVYAVEKEAAAFAFLQKNRDVLNLAQQKKLHLLHSDWNHFHERVDVIISNPPYISEKEFVELDPSVRDFEPKTALVGETTYREIFAKAQEILNPGGVVFLEYGPAQIGLWDSLIPKSFRWESFNDLSGKPRFIRAFDLRQPAH